MVGSSGLSWRGYQQGRENNLVLTFVQLLFIHQISDNSRTNLQYSESKIIEIYLIVKTKNITNESRKCSLNGRTIISCEYELMMTFIIFLKIGLFLMKQSLLSHFVKIHVYYKDISKGNK